MDLDVELDNQFRETSVYGKARRLKFGMRQNTNKPGELFSADVCEPFDQSFKRYRYFVDLKDHFTKFRYVFFFIVKSQKLHKLLKIF